MRDLHLKVSRLQQERIYFACSRLNVSLGLFSGKEKMIDYLVGEIGQKLSVRTAPEKGYIRRTTIRVPMDPEDFNDLLSGLSRAW